MDRALTGGRAADRSDDHCDAGYDATAVLHESIRFCDSEGSPIARRQPVSVVAEWILRVSRSLLGVVLCALGRERAQSPNQPPRREIEEPGDLGAHSVAESHTKWRLDKQNNILLHQMGPLGYLAKLDKKTLDALFDGLLTQGDRVMLPACDGGIGFLRRHRPLKEPGKFVVGSGLTEVCVCRLCSIVHTSGF
jgi:hypothetical protein